MIKEAKNIYVYKNGIPYSLQFGNIYQNRDISYQVNSNFRIYYNGDWYKLNPIEYNFLVSSYRDKNNEIIFRITPPNEYNPRTSDLTIEFYNSENILCYQVNIFENDDSKYWDYFTFDDLNSGDKYTIKIRDLDNTSYDYEDGFWKYLITSEIIIV